MDFDKLHTFYQVASSGSITAATIALGIDKSSISRQLSQLEAQVGKRLFERQGKKLILTPHGNFLFDKARPILMEIEAVKTALNSDGDQITGTLTITTTHALTSNWLTHFIHKFIEQHPSLRLNIKASNLPLDLSLREADLAIRPYSPDQDDLIQEHLKSWRLRLYASPKYLKQFGTPKSPDDLENHRLIIFRDSLNLYSHMHTNWPLVMKTKKGKMRKPFLVINSLEGMVNLMNNGVGIGSLSDNNSLLSRGELKPVLHDELYYDVDAYFTYHKQFQGLSLIAGLEKFLKDYVKNENRHET